MIDNIYKRGEWFIDTEEQQAFKTLHHDVVHKGDSFLGTSGMPIVWDGGAPSQYPRLKVKVFKARPGWRFLKHDERIQEKDQARLADWNPNGLTKEWTALNRTYDGSKQNNAWIYMRENQEYRPLTYGEFMMRYDPEEEGKRLVFRRQDDKDFVRYITGYDKDGVVLGGTYVDWACLKELWEDDCGRKFHVAIGD